jgi:hypothetical protein
MGLPYPAGYKHLEGLLFVTTEAARAKFGMDAVGEVGTFVGDRLCIVPGKPTTVQVAASRVRQKLADDSITGVVILGNYEEVPSWAMVSTSNRWPETCPKPVKVGYDQDDWWVWSDDLYGDRHNVRMPEIPVSRMPIPLGGGWFRADPATQEAGSTVTIGLRSNEFAFADSVYQLIAKRQAMWPSPPTAAGRAAAAGRARTVLGPGDLEADRLYLVLHGRSEPGTPFKGEGEVTAVNQTVVGGEWQSQGVIFAAVCWGVLTATPAATSYEGAVVRARTPDTSIALALLDHGMNALVGFTALHYIPNDPTDASLGSPLHAYFWQHIANGVPPALAIFQARIRYLNELPIKGCDPALIAKAMKTFWSATCLGLGW